MSDLTILAIAILSGVAALIFLVLTFFLDISPIFLMGSILTNLIASGAILARSYFSGTSGTDGQE